MATNGKDTKHTRHIARKMHVVSDGKKCKMQKIDWCGRGIKLPDIATKNVGKTDLTPGMKYIVVRIDK